jgi:hypothetical protein
MSSTILGSGKKLEDFMLKTEVFDTPGNFTFNHPNPGNALEVEVLIVGAGGGAGGLTFFQNTGNVTDGTDGTDGGDTIWDVGGSPITANGGKGGKYYPFAGSTTGYSGDGYIKGHGPASNNGSINPAIIPGIPYGFGGYSGYGGGLGAGSTAHSGGGGTGYFKKFNATITNNVNITIGQAGINGDPDSNVDLNQLNDAPRSAGHGAIIVQYAKAAAGFPTVSVTNKPEWEHFGRVSWVAAANAAAQSVTIDTLTTLNINTEVLDTGNKIGAPSANQFTLEAGTYEVLCKPAIENNTGGGSGVLRLYNVTDSSSILSTFNEVTSTSDSSELEGVFTISSQKTVRLEFAYDSGVKLAGGLNTNNFSSFTDNVERIVIDLKWRPNS